MLFILGQFFVAEDKPPMLSHGDARQAIPILSRSDRWLVGGSTTAPPAESAACQEWIGEGLPRDRVEREDDSSARSYKCIEPFVILGIKPRLARICSEPKHGRVTAFAEFVERLKVTARWDE